MAEEIFVLGVKVYKNVAPVPDVVHTPPAVAELFIVTLQNCALALLLNANKPSMSRAADSSPTKEQDFAELDLEFEACCLMPLVGVVTGKKDNLPLVGVVAPNKSRDRELFKNRLMLFKGLINTVFILVIL